MLHKVDKNKARQKRHLRVRKHVAGTAARPRLNVYRSLANIYAQIIDDTNGVTLVSASTQDKGFAKRAKEKGIEEVVFDRGGYIYHGRVAALAEAARAAGLRF